MKKTVIASLLMFIFMLGCSGGGGGSDSKPSSTIKTKTGILENRMIQGLGYGINSPEKISSNGEFSYKDGETISFFIGDIKIGSVTAKEAVTLKEILGTNTVDFNGNIMALLSLLDTDQDIYNNSISINDVHSDIKNISEQLLAKIKSETDIDSFIAEAETMLGNYGIYYNVNCNCDTVENFIAFLQEDININNPDTTNPDGSNDPSEPGTLEGFKYNFLNYFHVNGYRLKNYSIEVTEKNSGNFIADYEKQFNYSSNILNSTLISYNIPDSSIERDYVEYFTYENNKVKEIVNACTNMDGVLFDPEVEPTVKIKNVISENADSSIDSIIIHYSNVTNGTQAEYIPGRWYTFSYINDSNSKPYIMEVTGGGLEKKVFYENDKIKSAIINHTLASAETLTYEYTDGRITGITSDNVNTSYLLNYDANNNISEIIIDNSNDIKTITFTWENGEGFINNPFLLSIDLEKTNFPESVKKLFINPLLNF